MQTQLNELSDARWQIIKQILNDKRKRKHNLRDVVDCILEILRTGTQWRNLKHPGSAGKSSTIISANGVSTVRWIG